MGWYALLMLLATPADAPDPRGIAFFEARIRPMLTEHCVACHGPKKQQNGLRLDTRAGLMKGGDGGAVVEPGEPDQSPLLDVVRHDGAIKMPPRKRLPPEAVADLSSWIRMGAPWPESPTASKAADLDAWRTHWAFQPVREPVPPVVVRRDWARTTVDPFVLAKLERQGLGPSPEADRRVLIRRLTFDLIGLPPTAEEVAAFVADDRPAAYERLVERLLASPLYGERWGRHWLDVARYADTKGYVFFEDAKFPWSYTYRDYVVRAFNADLPYDRFILEQLAADQLPLGEDRRPLTALGFLTVGGRFMNNPHDVIDDRIDVVGRGLLGLTVSCARCHAHKFDPIPTEDYYALYGVFASTVEPAVPPLFEPPPDTPAYRAFEAELTKREKALEAFLNAKFDTLKRSLRTRAAEYLVAAQAALGKPDTGEFMLIADGGDLNPRMIRLWQSFLERTRRSGDPVFAPWHTLAVLPAARFPGEAAAYVARLAAAPDPSKPVNPILAHALAEPPPKSVADLAASYARLLSQVEHHAADYARRAQLNGSKPDPLPIPALDELRRAFHGPESPLDVAREEFNNLELLPDRESQGQYRALEKAVADWRTSGPGAPPRAMAVEDLPRPIEPRVFIRGNPNNLGSAVPRRFLTALSRGGDRTFRQGSGRLELARAIADRENPLTARVLVNRIWMHHFGSPLVGTPGDFGLRSDPPSHPELLDHLAGAFVAGGWSIKALHRRILLSASYRQASDDRPEASAIDPENAFLWRANRRRLEFEPMRDALLAVSGRLGRTLGGPEPTDLVGAGAQRRTLYATVDRLNLPGLFRSFDFPDPNATNSRRDRTTVPPQALFLMNNPFVLESARGLLQRPEVRSAEDRAARVKTLHEILYGRVPTDQELTLAADFLGGEEARPAAWERYAQALLIANEFQFVD